jgi:hypothetical protein
MMMVVMMMMLLCLPLLFPQKQESAFLPWIRYGHALPGAVTGNRHFVNKYYAAELQYRNLLFLHMD